MARSVVIFGGAGFIGSSLAGHCLRRGDRVHLVVHPATDCWRIIRLEGARLHRLEFSDRRGLRACLEAARADEVYFLAARTRYRSGETLCHDALESIKQNLQELLVVLDALGACSHPPTAFVRAGSLAEYGGAQPPFVETQRECPLNTYAASLVAATHYGQMLQSRLPFAVITARLALTYGPTQSHEFLIPSLIVRLGAGKPVVLDRPEDRRDLVHVDDVVAALCLLATRPDLGGEVVNVASGTAHRVADIAQIVQRALGVPPSLLIEVDQGDEPADAIADLRASTGKARDLLGWAPQIELATGVSRMILCPA